MKTQVFLFHADKEDSADLAGLLRNFKCLQMTVDDCGVVPEHSVLSEQLPEVPAIVFLPAVTEDCLGVKLAQGVSTENDQPSRVIILYGKTLPEKSYLCLAFRQGVDDIISLDSNDETLMTQLKRAQRLLRTRRECLDVGGSIKQQIDALQNAYESMEAASARQEERLIALASTAVRMATGELRISDSAYTVLIVCDSKSQAKDAVCVAEKLGFKPKVVPNGKEALAAIEQEVPKIVLTNGTLADMDAKVFAKSARKAAGNSPLIIIAWSSNPDVEEVLMSPDGGIDDFVLKAPSNQSTRQLAAALLAGLR